MRIAVLSDVHGNLPAFEAAVADARAQRPDLTVLLGDVVVGAPDTAACWALARSLACPILRGNHERYVADHGTAAAPAAWASEQFAPLHWGHAQLAAADRAAVAALPPHLRLADATGVLFVHASARNDTDSVAAHTPEPDVAAMFAGAIEPLVVRGHNHVGQTRAWDGGRRLVVTNGSVGLPLDGHPTAQYLLLDARAAAAGGGWDVTHRSVPYDVDAAAARFRDSGYLAACGPMARLFLRELVTATQQVVPFLRAYARWTAAAAAAGDAPPALGRAVDRFLNDP